MSISKNTDGKWEVSVARTAVTLSTAGKYLDADIIAKQASFGNLIASASITNVNGSGNVNPGTVGVNANTTAVTNKTRVASTPTTATSDITKYYIAVTATAAANSGQTFSVSGTNSTGASAAVETDGYVDSVNNNVTGTVTGSGTATANVQSKTSAVHYLPLVTGVLSASATVTGLSVNATSGNVIASHNSSAAITGKAKVTPQTVSTNTSDVTGPFVAIDAAAGTNSATFTGVTKANTASATVSTAGYVTSGENKSNGTTTISGSVDVAGGATATYYVGLTAGSVSSSVSGTNPTATGTLTVSTAASNYGVTTTAPSGTEGTNFLKFTPGASSNSQTFTASMSFTKGWIESKGSEGTKSVSATCQNGTPQYIPIVTPAFDGGAVTGSDIAPVISEPVVEYGPTGTFISNASTYGITTTKPSGTDGTNYLTVSGTATMTQGQVSGSTTLARAAVLYNGARKGAINIADDTVALSANSSAKTVSVTTTSIDAFHQPAAARYVPIVSATATGGTATASASIAKQPSASATATVTGMRTTSSATSYYFTASASAASGYSTASASATGGSASVSKGITSGASASGTSSGNKSATSTEVTASNSDVKYIPAATFEGGALTGGSAVTPTVTLAEVASGSQDTNIDISKTDVGAKDTTNYPYYFKISGASSSGSSTVSLSARTATSTGGGYVPDSGSVLAASSKTVTVNAGSGTSYVKMKKATLSASGSITNVSGSGSVNPGTVSIAENSASVSGKTNVYNTTGVDVTTTSSNISTYFIGIKATADAASASDIAVSGSGTGTASVTGEGYVKTSDSGTGSISASGNASVSVNSKDSAVYYVTLPTGAATVTANSKSITLSGNPTISGTTATWSSTGNTTTVSGKITATGWVVKDAAITTATFTTGASHSLTVYNGETA